MVVTSSLVKTRKGFTLVELAVVVVIIGVLAAFGVPRFMQSVERSKASESFAYLASVRTAQERYRALEGTYADAVSKLDVQTRLPRYFDLPANGEITPGATNSLEDSWALTLTRRGPSPGYGQYTVSYNDQGFDRTASKIPDPINPLGK